MRRVRSERVLALQHAFCERAAFLAPAAARRADRNSRPPELSLGEVLNAFELGTAFTARAFSVLEPCE